jgi:hypothetical protein
MLTLIIISVFDYSLFFKQNVELFLLIELKVNEKFQVLKISTFERD